MWIVSDEEEGEENSGLEQEIQKQNRDNPGYFTGCKKSWQWSWKDPDNVQHISFV